MYLFHQGRHTRQAHVGLPENSFEEEYGRDGFFGPVSHLYHRHPPTDWLRFEGPLRPHAFDFLKTDPPDLDDERGEPLKLLFNDDVAVHFSQRAHSMPFYRRNADADEVHFVHEGTGSIETDFGVLDFETGDYLVLPRCTTWRVNLTSPRVVTLIIEAFSRVRAPSAADKGLIGVHALYDPSAVTLPRLPEDYDERPDVEHEIIIKRGGMRTSMYFPFNPLDAMGWKGDLYPWKINVRDIRPVMSHRVHLPPPAHTTFLMRNAVVCTFLPRPLEEEADALKVPFYHRNADYDEMIFYHSGDFFSRDNIKPGMATLHPTGFQHGPHPGALAKQAQLTRTEEIAVMLDTVEPLRISREAEDVEWKEYWASWIRK